MTNLPKNILSWDRKRNLLADLFKQHTDEPKEAVNPKRRAERAEMKRLGFKSKKRYREWKKKMEKDSK